VSGVVVLFFFIFFVLWFCVVFFFEWVLVELVGAGRGVFVWLGVGSWCPFLAVGFLFFGWEGCGGFCFLLLGWGGFGGFSLGVKTS